jgi:hypothetical protein
MQRPALNCQEIPVNSRAGIGDHEANVKTTGCLCEWFEKALVAEVYPDGSILNAELFRQTTPDFFQQGQPVALARCLSPDPARLSASA